MDLLPREPVGRDWPRTAIFFAAAALVAAIGAMVVLFAWAIIEGLAAAGCLFYPLIVLTIFLAAASPVAVFILARNGWTKSCHARCPHCGAPLRNLAPAVNLPLPCPGCHEFVEGSGGFIETVEAGRIADAPVFSCSISQPPVWPPGCCVCGQPATHVEKFRSATPALPGLIQIPHCDAHRHGAQLIDRPAPTIRFRSYAYCRAFRELQKPAPPS